MSFLRVVPALRTPFGVDYFDYLDGGIGACEPGDLIVVPFRGRHVVGMVIAILSDSPFAGKARPALRRYADLRLSAHAPALLSWAASHTFSSMPSLLKSWLRNLPSRPSLTQRERVISRPHVTQTSGSLCTRWTTHPRHALLERARVLLAQGKKVLLLTPIKKRLAFFSEQLPASRVLASDQSAGDAFRAWSAFAEGEHQVLVATRIGAWLAPLADHVLLDEPEHDDHKQDELAPRYDARAFAIWSALHAGVAVECFGLTPPLRVDHRAPDLSTHIMIHTRRPNGRSSIPLIQSDTMLRLQEYNGPRIIIHPIRGISARIVCRDCGWRATCARCGADLSARNTDALCRVCHATFPLWSSCPSCDGADLGKSLPGIEHLKRLWERDAALPTVTWRDTTNEILDEPFPEHPLVLVTDGSWLGGGEDIRRDERRVIAFRRLADRIEAAHGTLIIQIPEETHTSHEHDIPSVWAGWLTGVGLNLWKEKERATRKLFGYPPAKRVVKLLIDGSEETAIAFGSDLRAALHPYAELRGPFSVAYRPRSRQPRYVWHAIFPVACTDEELMRLLSPCARTAHIDLDPTAFFK